MMSDAFNHARRNAQALAARQRKAGPHSGARRPDVFDRINEYEEEQLAELAARQSVRTFDIASEVRVTLPGPFEGDTGRIVSREMNRDGFIIFGVDFHYGERSYPVYFMANELETA